MTDTLPVQDHKKILLVEDDEHISRAYLFALRQAGYDVTLAEDGIEALRLVKDHRPDLIFLDLIIPLANGFEVLQKIKRKEPERSIPVVVISNLGQASDQVRCKKLGAAEFVIKSNVSLKDLVTVAERYIK